MSAYLQQRGVQIVPLLLLVVASALTSAGCTTLGPMPAMTMATPLPQARTGMEVQAAAVPGYFLSDTTRALAKSNSAMGQLAAWFEPGALLGDVKGLGVGLRWIGDGGGLVEPMVRLRQYVDDDERVALAGVLYGSGAGGESQGADYSMVRGGGEFLVDARLTPKNRWAELHLGAGLALTGLSATGHYCVAEESGFGRDCDLSDHPDREPVEARLSGVFPATSLNLAGEFFRGVPIIHSLRLAAYIANGTRPQLRYGKQLEGNVAWASWGMSLSLSLGEF